MINTTEAICSSIPSCIPFFSCAGSHKLLPCFRGWSVCVTGHDQRRRMASYERLDESLQPWPQGRRWPKEPARLNNSRVVALSFLLKQNFGWRPRICGQVPLTGCFAAFSSIDQCPKNPVVWCAAFEESPLTPPLRRQPRAQSLAEAKGRKSTCTAWMGEAAHVPEADP